MTSPSYACRNTAFDMPDLTDQSPSYVLTHPLSLSVHLCTVYVGGCARADTPRITYTFEGLEDLRDWRAESRRKERKHERTNELLISPVSCSLIYGFEGFEGRVPEEGRNCSSPVSCSLIWLVLRDLGAEESPGGRKRKNWLISCLLLAHVVFHVFQNFRYFKVLSPSDGETDAVSSVSG